MDSKTLKKKIYPIRWKYFVTTFNQKKKLNANIFFSTAKLRMRFGAVKVIRLLSQLRLFSKYICMGLNLYIKQCKYK